MSELPIPHPEYQALTDEIVLLREELTHLLTEEHDLLHITKPNLLALFQQKIGAWEVACLKAQIEALRTRRRLELAQAAINQGGMPNWTEIDAHLELEFLAWQQKLRESMERLTAAEHRMTHLLSPLENLEIKKLYYSLVKKLHPDVNPDLSENERRLWRRVQEAYESSDMEELRALALLVDQSGPVATPTPETFDKLRRNRDALRKQITEMERRIELIESQPPFPLRKQLADEAWVASRREEIETRTAHFEAQRAALDVALQTLLELPQDGQKFGLN